MFFERFDEFRELEPIRILKCQLDKETIKFFHSSGVKRWTIKEEEPVIIGPSQELYIVEYEKGFGSTIHHRIEHKTIHSNYYKNVEEAIISAEREYGKSLIWKEVASMDIENIYKKIN